LLRHLAIFCGGFTVEAAAALVSEGIGDRSFVMEGIANLVAKSLVVLDRDIASRWFLLETIRAYALEKLDLYGELDTAARHHAMYFRDLFSRSALESSASASAHERTRRVQEIDNVRAALDWCLSAGGDTALGVDLAAGSAVWWRVDVATSMLDTARGARQSLDLLTKALYTAEALGDLDAQARALVGVVTHHSFCTEHDKTRAAAERLLQVADRMGNVGLHRNAEGLMGCALVMVGRPREAQETLRLNLDRPMPDQSRWSGIVLTYRGVVHAFLSRALWLLGFIDQAQLEAQASVDELPVTYHPLLLCRVLSFGVCRIMPITGDFEAAEQSIARLIEVATRINAPFWETAGRFLSGKLMIERGDFARGVAVLNGAFDTCRGTGWRMSYPEFKGALATGLAGLCQFHEALVAVNEGLDDVVQTEHGHDLFFAELLRIKGEILLRRDSLTAAEESFRQALNTARQQEALFWELRASLSLARVRVNQGRGDEARRLVAQVYDRFTEGFETPDLRAANAFLDELPG
jgi:predicted ATPase